MNTPHKVLLIDDDDLVRETLQSMFEDLGHCVVGAVNGREGIAAGFSEKPDVVFTDLQMPEMDGFGFISAVKEPDPDLPIIVVSGAGTLDDAIKAVRLGA